MRIIHLSDIHVWRYAYNPLKLFSKRVVGMVELLMGRAKRFRIERLEEVVARVRGMAYDHLLITGDLTTTALTAEFRDAKEALAGLLGDPEKVSIVPGNHDRYTSGSVREKKFESTFGSFAPATTFPWLRRLDDQTSILGLDPTRSHISARGFLPPDQLEKARALIAGPDRPRHLIVACHYPVAAPPPYERELAAKRLKNAEQVRDWLKGIGPHLFCCGHVHAAWAFRPPGLPNQLCLNAGAPLLRDPTGFHLPGFLEIMLDGDGVTAVHHAWSGTEWMAVPMIQSPAFFGEAGDAGGRGATSDPRTPIADEGIAIPEPGI